MPNGDHDLLIRVDENVKNLIEEVKSLRDDSNRRIANLENHKLDKVEFDRQNTQCMKEIHDLKVDVEHRLADRTSENNRRFGELITKDSSMDTRLAKLERIVWIGLGGLAVLQFIVSLMK